MKLKNRLKSLFLLIVISLIPTAYADGLAIDKVYHPYVQPLEREVEWRMISTDGEQKHRLGIGMSLSDRFFVEGYIIASNNEESIDAYELEAKWQLTEQGEYDYDWGLITELEKDRYDNNWEFATGVLVEKEWGRWIGAANLLAVYEWGDTIKNELESKLAIQARYRYSRYFEPAIELYSGQDTRGLGPVVMGDLKFGQGRRLHWEAGAIFGLDDKTPDNTWRLLTEYEF